MRGLYKNIPFLWRPLLFTFLQERYIILRTKNDSIMEIVISVIIVIIAVCYIANRVKKQEQAQKHAAIED